MRAGRRFGALLGVALAAAALAWGLPPGSGPRIAPAAAASLPESPSPPGALEFVAIGDWGRMGSRPQREVAGAMAAWAAAHPLRFVLSTGDNFYGYGVSSVADPHWKGSFEDPYAAPSLQVPWWVALGNHDYRGSVEAQIAYGRRNPRWRMPARTFTFSETVGGGRSAQFFVLDTSPYLRMYRRLFSLTKVESQDPAPQTAWLDRELAASTADWKIVVGHHPIRSCGPHGDSPELVRDVLPLLVRHGAAVYLNGHDHSLQHLREGGVAFLTSGGGSEVTRVSPDGRTVWAEATGGFLAFTVTPDALRVRAVDAAGRLRHEATLARPGAAGAAGPAARARPETETGLQR